MIANHELKIHVNVNGVGGETLAAGYEEDSTALVFEGNWYFAPEAVDMTYLKVTNRTYTCPYKGVCFWIDLDAPDVKARNIGWVYRHPAPGYEAIQDRIAFYARETGGTLASVNAVLVTDMSYNNERP